MKRQVWFKTNLGYHATKDQLLKSRMITGDMQSWKGRLTFYLKDFKDVTFQITTRGKLGITYPEGISYEDVLEKLKPLLVKADGAPAETIGVIERVSEPKEKETVKRKVKNVVEKLRHECILDIILACTLLLNRAISSLI